MNDSFYRIWDFIGIEWHSPLWTPLPQYAQKFHYFRTSPAELDSAPVRLIVHSGKPPKELLRSIVGVAERFGIGDDIMQTGHQKHRMRFTSWVSGLETPTVRIWYDFPVLNRIHGTTTLFPDYLIAFEVIEPIIEYKLQQMGAAVLHAGAFSLNGKTTLLAGRGGSRKSTYLINAIRNGGAFFADDFLILKDGKAYPYPMCDTYFDYFYRKESDETVDLRSMFGAFLHIFKDRPLSYRVASPAPVDQVVLLIASERKESEIVSTGVVDEAAIEQLAANDCLERLNCGDEEEVRGRYLLHFCQHFGNDAWEKYWEKHRELLRSNLSGLPYRTIHTGKDTVPEITRA